MCRPHIDSTVSDDEAHWSSHSVTVVLNDEPQMASVCYCLFSVRDTALPQASPPMLRVLGCSAVAKLDDGG